MVFSLFQDDFSSGGDEIIAKPPGRQSPRRAMLAVFDLNMTWTPC